jgi:hypothetical protein
MNSPPIAFYAMGPLQGGVDSLGVQPYSRLNGDGHGKMRSRSQRWQYFKVDGILYDQRRSALGLPYYEYERTENYGATIPLMELRDDEHDELFNDCEFYCCPVTRGVTWNAVMYHGK